MKSTAMTYVSAPNESNIYSVLIKKKHSSIQANDRVSTPKHPHATLLMGGGGGGGRGSRRHVQK